MKAIILAAGYSQRLGEITKHVPKALLQVGGKPVLTRLTEKLLRISCIDEIIIVSNHRYIKLFEEWLVSQDEESKGSIILLDDMTQSSEERLGALCDLQFAVKRCGISRDVLVCAADNMFDFELFPFVQRFFEIDRKPLLLVKESQDLHELKRVAVALIGPEGEVLQIEEKPALPKGSHGVYALYAYPKEALLLLDEYLLEGNPKDSPGSFPPWLCKRMPVYSYAARGDIIDIGLPEALKNARLKYGE
ncbi:MAG: nucleotidyltransferase family protein [Christensenellales bacterium]|jgi:glucose-1-phosphate thymidylyltransferase